MVANLHTVTVVQIVIKFVIVK